MTASIEPISVSPVVSPPPSAAQYNWQEDPLTQELVHDLQRGESVETRAFIKPIFKWMKTGVRKSGQKNHDAIEKAFAFVMWMEMVTKKGDPVFQIAPQPQLDASYALNTIVTSAQRASSREEAERAFQMLLHFGYTPDTFTYTALIDVLARSRDVKSAFARYQEMRTPTSTSSHRRPNLVVFLTVIRAVGFSDELPVDTCLTLLEDARRDGVFDDSLYVRSMEMCAKRRDGAVATLLLQQMDANQVGWKAQQPILRAVQRTLQRIDNADEMLASWLATGLVTLKDVDAIKVATSMMQALYQSGSKALGCARHVSESARHAVMIHAIDRLVERLVAGAKISTNEFETLIHQCRKRKRKDDVLVILTAMRDIAMIGWTLSSSSELLEDTDDHQPRQETKSIAPQPQLMPNSATYAAVVETFLACDDEESAWQVFLDTTTTTTSTSDSASMEFVREPLLYRKYFRGCCLLGKSTHIMDLLKYAHLDGIPFTTRMGVDLARMHATAHDQGIQVVLHQIPLLSRLERHFLLQELADACGARRNSKGVRATLAAMQQHGYARTATTDLAVLTCCLHEDNVDEAIDTLRDFQANKLLLDTPVYASLLREIFFKCTRHSGDTERPAKIPPPQKKNKKNARRAAPAAATTTKDLTRRPALKMLHVRRGLIEKIAELQPHMEAAEQKRQTTGGDEQDFEMTHRDNHKALQYWTVRHGDEYAPMMVLQHIVEATTTVIDKQQRLETTSAIQQAILSTPDPMDFIVRAVCALPWIGESYRTQAKLTRQLLTLVQQHRPRDQSKDHEYVSYVLSKLPLLSMDVVKELDDALHLVQYEQNDLQLQHPPQGFTSVLTFCIEALQQQRGGKGTEKIVAFLLSRPAFSAHGAATRLIPVFAQLYVVENDPFVLHYFRESTYSDRSQNKTTISTETRREFLRQVIQTEQEKLQQEEEELPLPLARRAIVEFKLEHEGEFLPIVLNYSDNSSNTSTSTNTSAPTCELPAAMANNGARVYLKLPLPSSCVVIVDDQDSLQIACEVLQYQEDTIRRIAMDAEWKPNSSSSSSSSSPSSRCALLQIACDSHVFLFDLLTLEEIDLDDDLDDLLTFLFTNEAIVKLGFGIDTDLQRLRLLSTPSSEDLVNFVDFASPHHHPHTSGGRRGLSALVEEWLGSPLDKSQQVSDWERRPLSKDQITYAALDAYCLLLLHTELEERQRN